MEEGAGFSGVRDGGLFEKDVFSGLEGSDGPFIVEAVGKRVIDCVDGEVVEKGLVGCVDVGDVVLLGIGMGADRVTSSDGDNNYLWVRLCGIDDGDGAGK